MKLPDNPFIGPRPFERGERLFGRDTDLFNLLDLLIAERLVMFYSPSGAGKSSLIEAALIPRLEKKRFTVLRVNRFAQAGSSGEGPSEQSGNQYIADLIRSLEKQRKKIGKSPEDSTPVADSTLTDYWAGFDTEQGEGKTNKYLLIFDQFEEIITRDPLNIDAKHEFFLQLGRLLQNRRIWALFALREDYIAGLDPFLEAIPTRLKTRYRLDLLGTEEASDVILQTVKQGEKSFADEGLVEQLVRDLSMIKIQNLDGSFTRQPGNHVEPIYLQVTCRRLWSKLRPESGVIGPEDLSRSGSVNEALADYYEEHVQKIAAGDMATERRIREWFSEKLISSGSIRLQVIKEKDSSGGLDNALISKLIESYLVRRDDRSGVTWFELAHDRLVQPIVESNRHWFQDRLVTVQVQAKSWDEQGRPDSLLLRGRELREARKWAKSNSALIRPVEEELIRKSVIKRNRTFWKFGAISILLGMGVAVIWMDRQNKQKIALESMRSELNSARFLIDSERYQDASEVLDREIFTQMKDDLSPNLREMKGLMQWYLGLVSGKPEASLPIGSRPPLYTVAQSPDGKYLAAGGEQGTLILYNLAEDKIEKDFSEEHSGRIYSIIFDPKNKWFAYAGTEKRIVIRSLEPGAVGEILTCWPTGHAIFSLAVDPKGNYIASGGGMSGEETYPSEKTKRNWEEICRVVPTVEGESGSAETPQDKEDRKCLVDNKDGFSKATSDHAVSIWNVADVLIGSGSLFPEKELIGHCNHIVRLGGLVFSPDPEGKWLVSAEEQGVVYIWDWKKGAAIKRKRIHEKTVKGIALNDDGRVLATVSDDKSIRLLKIPSLELSSVLIGHRDKLSSVSFANNGKWLLSSGDNGAIRIWDRTSGVTQRILEGHESAANEFLIATHDQHLYSVGDDGTLRRWNDITTANQKTIPLEDCAATAAAIASDGLRFAVGCQQGTLSLYSRDDIDQNWRRQWGPVEKHQGGVTRLAFSPDRQSLASVGHGNELHLSKTNNGKNFRPVRLAIF